MDVVFPSTRTIAREAVPSVLVGVAAAVIPIAMVLVTDRVTDLLYRWIPDLIGSTVTPDGGSSRYSPESDCWWVCWCGNCPGTVDPTPPPRGW